MLRPVLDLIRQFRRLACQRTGNVAILFAFAAIPVIGGVGMAIDTARTFSVKVRLAAALDAAALAVGSQFNQSNTQLSTEMQNYFTANYPSSALGSNVSISTVPANATLTATSVTYKAQATVPMLFLPLVGINTVDVTVSAQTHKTTGIEVALVLDNTGSMLCGPNDGAPNYADSTCGTGVVSTDTSCTNSTNQSRICTLINASKSFVNTLTAAITTSQQLYISVVPYVTTVNVGNSLCTGATTCSHIATDACSGAFIDYTGAPITQTTSAGTFTADVKNATAVLKKVSSFANVAVGTKLTGTGIPANAVVKTFDSVAKTITLCKNATSTSTGVTMTAYAPVVYDTTSTATTTNWMGCVVEPTSSDENASGSGALASSTTDPDYTEPSGGWPSWYPFWWTTDATYNPWPTVVAQNSSNETQGQVVANWLRFPGPNQGCPVPLLPLTDATTAAGKTTILNSIGSMWPREEGGTQVHIGMIWGWRALSPNGPFTKVNNHPLDYATQASSGWKKIVVLMTDGAEEWPVSISMTGLGQLADGKIGTTSTTTAASNLDTRLANVCSNMAASGNFVIYTIGLGSDGASNAQLQSCPGNTGGFFEAATPSNLTKVFDDIAKSMLSLQLTK